jgi:hypothetical protein
VGEARMRSCALCAPPWSAALGTRGPQFPFRVAGPATRLHPDVVPPFGQSGCGSVPPRTDPLTVAPGDHAPASMSWNAGEASNLRKGLITVKGSATCTSFLLEG